MSEYIPTWKVISVSCSSFNKLAPGKTPPSISSFNADELTPLTPPAFPLAIPVVTPEVSVFQ